MTKTEKGLIGSIAGNVLLTGVIGYLLFAPSVKSDELEAIERSNKIINSSLDEVKVQEKDISKLKKEEYDLKKVDAGRVEWDVK